MSLIKGVALCNYSAKLCSVLLYDMPGRVNRKEFYQQEPSNTHCAPDLHGSITRYEEHPLNWSLLHIP